MPVPLTPADSIAAIIAWLSQAVAGRGMLGHLTNALVGHIVDRLRGINQSVSRTAARVAAGRYRPRPVTPRRRPQAKPRAPNPLPRKAGWLLPLVPDAVSAIGQLETLFRDPAMQALLAAAPNTLARPLRSLCRMLGTAVPPVIAPPARPRKPRPARPPKPRPSPPPRPEGPAWMRGMPRIPWTMTRMTGARKRP